MRSLPEIGAPGGSVSPPAPPDGRSGWRPNNPRRHCSPTTMCGVTVRKNLKILVGIQDRWTNQQNEGHLK